MDIGSKIKEARLAAQMTQEAVADALGVNRQTVSSWENSKTYPDIVSVIRMSDLYKVSLDHLLKEESTTPPAYLDYLAESTDTVRSNDRKRKTILISVCLFIWAAAILVFWFFLNPGDAIGYSIAFEVVLLPVTIFVFSLLIGRNHFFGHLKWLATVVCGLLYMLANYATFLAANMASVGVFRLPHFPLFFIGAAVSALGLSLGHLARIIRRQKKNKS